MTTRRSFLKSLLGVATTVVVPSTVIAEIAPTLKKFGEESSLFTGVSGYIDEIKITEGEIYSSNFDPYDGDFTIEGWFNEKGCSGWEFKTTVRREDTLFHYTNGELVSSEPYSKPALEDKWVFFKLDKPVHGDFFLHNTDRSTGFPISKRM